MIITIEDFIKLNIKDFIATSGGFDPIHKGHIKCLTDCKINNLPLVVIVNDDDFLLKKKGYVFMNLEERMFIVDNIKGVDYVISWHSEDGTVIDCLRKIRPTFFMKGGDRDDKTNIPEWKVCEAIGCVIITNVGGNKEQSSSKLIEKVKQWK